MLEILFDEIIREARRGWKRNHKIKELSFFCLCKHREVGTEVPQEKWIYWSTIIMNKSNKLDLFQPPPEEQEFCRFLLLRFLGITSAPKGKIL